MELQNQHATTIQKCLVTTFLIILTVLIGSYLYFDHYFSRAATTDRFITAIKTDNTKTAVKLIQTDDPDFKTTPATVEPLLNYYRHNPQEMAVLKRRMNNTGVINRNLDFIDAGHHFFLFEKYVLNVKTIFLTIQSTQANNTIKINHKTVAQGLRKNVTRTFGPIIPGRYTIQVTAKVNGRYQTNEKIYNWIDPTPHDLNLKNSFTSH